MVSAEYSGCGFQTNVGILAQKEDMKLFSN